MDTVFTTDSYQTHGTLVFLLRCVFEFDMRYFQSPGKTKTANSRITFLGLNSMTTPPASLEWVMQHILFLYKGDYITQEAIWQTILPPHR